jgi:GT2 family glycosyltransferase
MKDINILLPDFIEKQIAKIESYNKSWELIQIFKPKEDSKFVQVLFREKVPLNS